MTEFKQIRSELFKVINETKNRLKCDLDQQGLYCMSNSITQQLSV